MELDKIQGGLIRKPQPSNRQQYDKAKGQKGNYYNCGKQGHYANKYRRPKENRPFIKRNNDRFGSNRKLTLPNLNKIQAKPASINMLQGGPSREERKKEITK
jgi:hypothetical protein